MKTKSLITPRSTYIRSILTRLQNKGTGNHFLIAVIRTMIRNNSLAAFNYFERHIDASNGIWKLSSDFDKEKLMTL